MWSDRRWAVIARHVSSTPVKHHREALLLRPVGSPCADDLSKTCPQAFEKVVVNFRPGV
jgi:hypothetical protein